MSLGNLWEEIKHEHFQNSTDRNLFLVTDVYTTSTWAQEYRTSSIVQDKYVVNVQNVRGQDEIPENFEIRTTSSTIQPSPRQYPQFSTPSLRATYQLRGRSSTQSGLIGEVCASISPPSLFSSQKQKVGPALKIVQRRSQEFLSSPPARIRMFSKAFIRYQRDK